MLGTKNYQSASAKAAPLSAQRLIHSQRAILPENNEELEGTPVHHNFVNIHDYKNKRVVAEKKTSRISGEEIKSSTLTPTIALKKSPKSNLKLTQSSLLMPK